MLRRAFYLATVGLLGWSAVLVPMPFVELAPGTPTSIAPLISMDAQTTEINGEYELLTVLVRQPTFVDSVEAWLSPDRDLQLRQQVIPPGLDSDEYFRLQRLQFERAFRVAVAVGLRAAGEQVTVTTRPVAFAVLDGGPSDGVLEAGDVIVEVNGVEVTSGEQLRAEIEDAQMGERIRLVIDRDGERREAVVRAGLVPELERPGLGVVIETVGGEIELPYDVQLDRDTGIGGPSAGLMVALTTYDLISDEDLARGRVIAGTGTIDADGNVGPIGGVPEKVVAAGRAGANVVLVPVSQLASAQRVAPPGLEVIGVSTLEEAIEALRADG